MPGEVPSIYITEPSPLARFWWLLRKAFMNAWDDNCFAIAKGAAYSSMMAFFPVMTGKNAIMLEYAAPLAMAKQLSSQAFMNALRNNHQNRAKGLGSVM